MEWITAVEKHGPIAVAALILAVIVLHLVRKTNGGGEKNNVRGSERALADRVLKVEGSVDTLKEDLKEIKESQRQLAIVVDQKAEAMKDALHEAHLQILAAVHAKDAK